MSQTVSIKQLAPDDRPREKMMVKGSASLSDAEVLAILIGSGTREKSAVDLCREVLRSVDNDLSRLGMLALHDLMRFKGIGEAKAITIAAALELARRRKNDTESSVQLIHTSRDAFRLVVSRFEYLLHEEFYAIMLSRSNKVLSVELISKGGMDSTIADGKLIFKRALERSANGVILAHNHPSGVLKPSESDILLTKKLSSFGTFIDLPVLDHLIIADGRYFSFADQGLIIPHIKSKG